MAKRLFTPQAAWPYLVLLGAFSLICTFLGDFRHSDPDQYFHFSVAREWAEHWNIWTLPQVVGMGWDHFFNDKEFLFHVYTAIAYIIAGDFGVLLSIYLLSFLVVVLVYQIICRLTSHKDIALFGALALFLSDTFVMHLMLVRAYVLALVLVLFIIYCLLEHKNRSLLITCFFFSWSYHAFYVPIFIILVFMATERSTGNKYWLPLWSIGAILLGSAVNPYFPNNYIMTWLGLNIVADQFHWTELAFGMEQKPFRSDNLILVFRFSFLFLILGSAVLWHSFFNSQKIQKPEEKNIRAYLFFSLLSSAFFLLLFLSPRVQIYFIPFVAIYGALALNCFTNRKKALLALSTVCVVLTAITWPYKKFNQSISGFKQFDQSYLEMTKKIPAGKMLFNCEWWGGNYAMYSNPDIKVVDVLDPELLRARDNQLFETVTQLRLAKTLDPYFMIGSILKYEYVLCSAETKLHQQIARDPRFLELAQSHNYFGELSLFQLKPEVTVYGLQNLETKKDNTEWKPRPLKVNGIPMPIYIFENQTDSCTWIRPLPDDSDIISQKNYFAFSGIGVLSVYKNDALYLDPTVFSDDFVWGEILLPIAPGKNKWTFKVCPRKSGAAVSMGVFLFDKAQKDIWCKTTPIPDPQPTYTVTDRSCKGITAVLNENK